MKALFIACDQALYVEVQQKMAELGVRGYTSWEEVMGCGTESGEPHLGDAVWPMMNSAMITGMPSKITQRMYIEMNAPPPCIPASYGKRQMFPSPTAEPTDAAMTPIFVANCALSDIYY